MPKKRYTYTEDDTQRQKKKFVKGILLESKYIHRNYKFNYEDVDFNDFQSFDKQDYLDRINYETQSSSKSKSSDYNVEEVDQSPETAPQVYFLRGIINDPNPNSILSASFSEPNYFGINNNYGYPLFPKKPIKRDSYSQYKTVTRYIKQFRTTPTVKSTSTEKIKNNIKNKHFTYKIYGIHRTTTSIDDSCEEIERDTPCSAKTTRCKTILHPFKSCGNSTKKAGLLKNSISTSTTKKLRATTATTEETEPTKKCVTTTKAPKRTATTQPTRIHTITTTKKNIKMKSETIEEQDSIEECSKFAITKATTEKTTKMQTTKKTTCKTVLEHLQDLHPACETTKKHFKWPHIHFNHTTQISKCTNYYGMILCPNCGKKVRYNMQVIRNKPKETTTTSEHYEFV